mmetsp:Transcript_34399/g.56968  ORF Transcript_34399/g.56968 Transcript_34399/m.56968 type:complete len:379 (+) Transcript_34399:91-1227(+)
MTAALVHVASFGLSLGATGVSVTYEPPDWVPIGLTPPRNRLLLAHLPTPMHKWLLPGNFPGVHASEVWIKRDDCTGCELSGNKVRKLEFLLADAVAQGCTDVITVGGIQSNHCRATAAAARRVGLKPHLILRAASAITDPGLVGNLLIDRLVGAELHLVNEDRFAARGGWGLCQDLKEELEELGAKVYAFPSGGSNPLGTWGYIHGLAEIAAQAATSGLHFERIYFACGSGGTAAGLALGVHYAGLGASGTELVGLGVDDTPEFFYEKLRGIMRACHADFTDLQPRELLRIEQCVGDGYAESTPAELEFIAEVARATGMCLDPVYTGKAALGMVLDLEARPVDGRVLFIHTGGLLGLYAKEDMLATLLSNSAANRNAV